MQIDSIQMNGASPPRPVQPADQVDRQRHDLPDQSQADVGSVNKPQPEELLQQIKSITDDGLYSVRFEKDDASHELIVKIVDSETDEVIRQIPPEELLSLTKQLKELQGNLVDTLS